MREKERNRRRALPRACILLGLLWAPSAPAAEQGDRVYGDPSLREPVERRTHAIYEAASRSESPHTFLLTTANLLLVADASGTEATGVIAGSAGRRNVATVWSKKGKYSVEYYHSEEGALLFVYETFVYFDERAPRGAWRNFMGLAGWERRSYFDGQPAVGYSESRGKDAPPPGSGGVALREAAMRLAHALAARPRQN